MRIPDNVRKSTIFVSIKIQEEYKLVGTGFFIGSHKPKDPNKLLIHLVTAKHVIMIAGQNSTDNKIWLRINTKDGNSTYFPTDRSEWQQHPNDTSVDAMILPCVPNEIVDYVCITQEQCVSTQVAKDESIGIGDPLFITGLFVNHSGKQKNLPIIRMGNIAAMPEEPVNVKNFGDIEAYLIEARSIGGLSGSPVFVNLSGSRTVNGATTLTGGNKFYLLGLMHGHWDVNLIPTALIEKEAVNMGIGIVVPAEKILEIINNSISKSS